MKFAALAFALLLVGALAHADVIEPNTHAVDRCVKVTNVDSFPGIYLIAEITAPGTTNQTQSMYAVKQGECLTKGYKFDGFNVYWANRSYIDSVGGAQSADRNSGSMHLITSSINPYGAMFQTRTQRQTKRSSTRWAKTTDGYSLEMSGGIPNPSAKSPFEAFCAGSWGYSGRSAEMELSYEQLFLCALCFTVAVETAVLFLCARLLFKMKKKDAPDALLLFLRHFSLLRNASVCLVHLPAFTSGAAYVAGAELFAFAAEAIGYK